MQAQESALGFLKKDMKLEIPYFQRSYVWKENNWEELFDNLIDENQSHFLGSIILKRINTRSGETERFSVIDGQQRLTTLSILLRASYDNIAHSKLDEETRAETNTKLRMMLFYKVSELSSEKFVKIIHSHLDLNNYDSVINGKVKDNLDSIVLDSEASKSAPSTESGILKCYKYFHNKLTETPNSAEKIWNVLVSEKQKLLVKIDLDADENEQAIFDSVNSSGVRLTSADTIKNTLFQKMMELVKEEDNTEEVIKLYTDNWEKTFMADVACSKYWSAEQRLGRITRDNLELLLHCVALIKGFFDPEKHSMLDLADVYKKFIVKMDKHALIDFVKEIADYAKIYRKVFISDPEQSFEFNDDVQRLRHILAICDVSTLNAYVLYLLRKYHANADGCLQQILIDELKNLETMVFRYTLCKVSNKNFNKICALFIKETKTVRDEMLSNQHNINDSAIKNALCNIPNNKMATLLLFWIELYRRSKDSKYDVKDLKYTYSLEHVMPQSWEQNWGINAVPVVTDSGNQVHDEEKAKELRRAAIYEIGNMTILNRKLNSSLSNKEIKSKVAGMKKYADLGVAKEVISTIENCNTWNEKNIRDRTEDLYKIFIELWPVDFSS